MSARVDPTVLRRAQPRRRAAAHRHRRADLACARRRRHRAQQEHRLEPGGRARRARPRARGRRRAAARRRSAGRRRRSSSPARRWRSAWRSRVDGLAACLEDLTGAVRFEARRTRMLGDDPPLAGARRPRARWRARRSPAPQTDELRVRRRRRGRARASSTSGCGRCCARPTSAGRRSRSAPRWRRGSACRPACVAVGNEANLAALAELWDGVARDLRVVHPRHRPGRRRRGDRDRRRAATAARAASPASSGT